VTTDAAVARLVWQFGEPVQAVTYYVPEVRRRTDELGLKGGWMSYFGCRAAPLGSVAPAVVCAVFYNFHPRMVYRAIPDAWALAGCLWRLGRPGSGLAIPEEGLWRLPGADGCLGAFIVDQPSSNELITPINKGQRTRD
jgi:hypothetical protein